MYQTCDSSLLIVFLLMGPSWAWSQSKKPAIIIGYSGVGIAHDLLKIMAARRTFEKHGVNATSIYIGSGSLMNQAVVGGSIQFTTSDLPSQIQSAIAGVDFKVISVTINRLDGAVMTLKSIRTPQDSKVKNWRSAALVRFQTLSPGWCSAIGASNRSKMWLDSSRQYAQSNRGHFQRAS